MPMTASDLLHDADAFRRAYPNWPSAGPEPAAGSLRITADSPAVLDDAAEEIAREERWS